MKPFEYDGEKKENRPVVDFIVADSIARAK
jgi:hypothetical protein